MTRSCETCAWWLRVDHPDRLGECRGAPPTASGARIIWPITGAADWCGAFRPSEAAIRAPEGEGEHG